MTDIKIATEANRKVWDLSAKHHRKSSLWPALKKGVQTADFSCFDATASAALDTLDLTGKSVVQIGCNNGREVFSLSAFGATGCLGIDQSSEFIKQAQELNALSDSQGRFPMRRYLQPPQGHP